MTAVLTFSLKREAESVLNTMAGELGARYDALLGRYVYSRDGHERHMWLGYNKEEQHWEISIEELTDEHTDTDAVTVG